MNILFFVITFLLLSLFYTALALYSSKKVVSNDDYFLAGRNLGLMPLSLTLIATQLGGAMLLGTSENGYLYGIYGILYTAGIAIGFLLLSMGIASRLRALNVATTAEIFQTHYKSPFLKHVASFLSIITLCGILIGQVVASRSIVDSLALSGSATELLFLCFWSFIILYTIVGGLHAVVTADGMQVAVIVTVFASVFFYSLWYGPAFDWTDLATIQKDHFGAMPLSSNMIIATLIMPALFSLIEQDLAQRFFAARTRHIATLAAVTSCIFMIAFAFIPIYFGMQAKLMGLPLAANKSPLLPVIEELTNGFVTALCLCAIIAAITSTADSLLCAISSNIAQDFDIGKSITNSLARSQTITLIVGIVAVIGSYFVPQNIITIMIDSYSISVSCLLIPLLAVYFDLSRSRAAATAAVVAGAVAIAIVPFITTELPTSLIPLLFSFIAYTVGQFLMKKTGE